MATVHIQKRKRKNRNSYVLYYKDPASSKLKYFKTFQRQKDAQQAANDLRTLIDTGKASEIEKNKAKISFMIFSEVSAQLELDWKRRLEMGDLKQKTVCEYLYMLNSLNKIFGKKLLCEISKEDILTYRSSVASEFSKVTSNRYLFIIKQVFKQGIATRAALGDPADSINYLSEKEQERNNFLLPSRLDRLVDASLETRAKFYLPSLIYLGLNMVHPNRKRYLLNGGISILSMRDKVLLSFLGQKTVGNGSNTSCPAPKWLCLNGAIT